MEILALGVVFVAFLVYIAITPQHKLESHLAIVWGLMALSVVAALIKGLISLA